MGISGFKSEGVGSDAEARPIPPRDPGLEPQEQPLSSYLGFGYALGFFFGILSVLVFLYLKDITDDAEKKRSFKYGIYAGIICNFAAIFVLVFLEVFSS